MSLITPIMRENAEHFILNWRGVTAERAEAQTFTNEFFEIFGLYRKDYAQYEKPIQKKDNTGRGFADLFWSGKLIIESKSAHKDNVKDWEETLQQATEYIENLLPHQRPQFILLMNFKRIHKYAVEIKGEKINIYFINEIAIEDLAKRLTEFEFFLEFAGRLASDEEKVNQEAARRIANVYDAMDRRGYNQNDISVLLAQLLFCLFAEDTGIFERKQFENYIITNTSGANLGDYLITLFETLNTEPKNRQGVNAELLKFPYVNGNLFKNIITRIPPTNQAMRDALLTCCAYDWSDISPVIFGSLFQAVMNDKERRNLGAHYTSEKNIARVLRPLFLTELQEEFALVKNNKKKLEEFRVKINSLLFLDPACGCGNFLVVTYRELRLLDIEIIRRQYKGTYVTDINLLKNIPLNNFYGYEIDKTSAMIAEIAMWLTEHQLNMRLESEFGVNVPTIPLDEAAHIMNANSLHLQWEAETVTKQGITSKPAFSYIIGNPPFIGKQFQTAEQKKDITKILSGINGAGVLDYVTCWHIKSAQYMQAHPQTRTALVSTNSIAQGEQPGILWNELYNRYKLKIQFAHQTFKWTNEDKDFAAVHCVIIGFGKENSKNKVLFEYLDIKDEPTENVVKNINPYLVKGNDLVILKTRKPLCEVPEISFGSMPNDGGYLLLTDEEKDQLLIDEPQAKKWIRPLISAHEYLNGKTRWCLWLTDIKPNELTALKEINKRVKLVKKHRQASERKATNRLALTPHLFGEVRQPKKDYIAIPRVSSENRKYIPIAFFNKKFILSDTCLCIPDATLYHFGILTSKMHMSWMRYVCGRLKSDYRYSNEIVYNNYPWPKKILKRTIIAIEKAAQKIIDVREKYMNDSYTLSDLYHYKKMPADLIKAHDNLDTIVDKCYRDTVFKTEAKRIEFLFELYETYNANLFTGIEN